MSSLPTQLLSPQIRIKADRPALVCTFSTPALFAVDPGPERINMVLLCELVLRQPPGAAAPGILRDVALSLSPT